MPSDSSPQGNGDVGGKSKGKGLSKSAVVAIIVCDIVGICLIGWLLSYCYSRVGPCKSKDEKAGRESRECCCFIKDESETLSENVEQYDLVHMDSQEGFDLDELLKASAFVLGKSGIGIVYKVVLEDGLTLAVRRLGEGGSQRFREFQTEVEAIGKLRHPNIVTLKAYYWSVDEKLLVYDYESNGSLATALHGKTQQILFLSVTRISCILVDYFLLMIVFLICFVALCWLICDDVNREARHAHIHTTIMVSPITNH